VATARSLLEAVAQGPEELAWERAQDLALLILADEQVALAQVVLEGGPFAMRKAEELAESVLDQSADRGSEGTAG